MKTVKALLVPAGFRKKEAILAAEHRTMARFLHLLVLAPLAHLALAQTNGNPLPSGPAITFTSVEHDFGELPFGGNGNCTFVFVNSGDAPLLITACRSSCGCVVPTWSLEPVLPGDTAHVQVKYDTRRMGPFTKTVTVESNAVNTPVVLLRIKGKVLAEQPSSSEK